MRRLRNGSRAGLHARGDDARLTRRGLMAGGAASMLAGCGSSIAVPEAEAAYPPIGQIVTVDGMRIHLWQQTPADPVAAARLPVVLIHGASGNLRDFTFSIAPRIAETRPVIAVDRPGFGYSDRPADGHRPQVQARLLRDAVTQLGVERSLVLGHSYGAAVTMAWALQDPQRTAGIVPVSGVTMPYDGVGRVFSALGLSGIVTWAYTQYLKSTVGNGGVERFLARVFRPQPVPEGYGDYVGAPLSLREPTLEANAADLQYINGELREMARAYPDLAVPAEIVHGEADFIEPNGQSVPLQATLPNANLTLLPNVGHMAHHVGTGALIAALDRLDPLPAG
ncbi:MAG: alpha/beta hydrolase [Pseudomonadota bacterium]